MRTEDDVQSRALGDRSRQRSRTPGPARRAASRLLQPNHSPGASGSLQRWQLWVGVLIAGVGAGLGAVLLMGLLRAVQHLAYDYSGGPFLAAVERAAPSRRVLVLLLAGILAGVGWYLLRRLGRGGGDVAGAVWTRDGHVPTVPTLGNAVLSIVVVAMGASLGREAAPQQVGAVAAFRGSRLLGLTTAERRLLVACGAAAGMGAVYNVPLGAALFATEVLLGEITLATVVPALATTSLATAVAWISLPNQPLYTSPNFPVTGDQLLWAALAGPVFGLAAAGWTRMIRWTTDHRIAGWPLLFAPLLVFTALGALAIPFPQLLGNGRNVVQLSFDSHETLGLVATLMVLKPLVTVACLGSGASGGLFTPTMTAGALLGSVLGRLWELALPGSVGGSYAILGAGAMLAASMQGPLAAAVLMVELVRQADVLLVPLLISGVGATVVVRWLRSDSIYSARVSLQRHR